MWKLQLKFAVISLVFSSIHGKKLNVSCYVTQGKKVKTKNNKKVLCLYWLGFTYAWIFQISHARVFVNACFYNLNYIITSYIPFSQK